MDKRVEPFLLLALESLEFRVELTEWILDRGVDRIDKSKKTCYI